MTGNEKNGRKKHKLKEKSMFSWLGRAEKSIAVWLESGLI